MNAILIFTLATIVNVVLSTIRSICTIKCGKWVSALTNAICYGFYPLIVMLTAKDTVSIIVNMGITAATNFICVWLIKLIEEKARKDKMWKVELAIPAPVVTEAREKLKNIPHNFQRIEQWAIFNCYCETQDDTKICTNLCKKLNGKISAYESKPLF